MENTLMFSDLSTSELYAIDGGINGDEICKGVAAIGVVAAACGCAPVTIVCGLFCAAYWITDGILG